MSDISEKQNNFFHPANSALDLKTFNAITAHLGKSSLDKNNIPVGLFCDGMRIIIYYIIRMYMRIPRPTAHARDIKARTLAIRPIALALI